MTMTSEPTENQVKAKVAYDRKYNILYLDKFIKIAQFHDRIRFEVCDFEKGQPFTVKWVDDDGDLCTITSQTELDEALRLYWVNREAHLKLHVFPNVPEKPGMACLGEDRAIYRRGARRWKKLYRVNGHIFQAKRFQPNAFCAYCSDRIWGLGRQGFRCQKCRVLVHKKCHRQVSLACMPGQMPADLLQREAAPSTSPHQARSTPDRMPIVLNDADINVPERNRNGRPLVGDVDLVLPSPSDSENVDKGASHDQLTVADFELMKVIGRGSYAKVFVARLRRSGRVYAMKVIKKEAVSDDEDIDWVQTEKHVFETASNYPFLVGLHSCFQTPSRLCFVIEFVSGGDLMFHMQRQRKLPEGHARFYSSEIILALNFLHERGIIYRDLKLDNVLLDAEGHIKLTDYGMCKEGILDGEKTSTFCGTPNYIAPEILRGEDYSYSVDYWALGVLMYEMMAGRSPFDIAGAVDNPDKTHEDYLFQVILDKPIRFPRSLSVRAQSVLKGFLNKDPGGRLGCNLESGFEDIQNHLYFKTHIDWELLERKGVDPPFRPDRESIEQLENFDPTFTNEPVRLTPDDSSVISRIDQSEFDGFEYVNPLLMSSEDPV